MIKGILFSLISLFLFSVNAYSQGNGAVTAKKERALIQFSGIVVEADSLHPIPFVSIMIKNSNRGTISDFFGFFSIVAQKNDTIEFAALGFKRAEFIIPDSLSTNKYSLIQILRTDTIQLKEAVIYPWPTREQFKQAFLSIEIPDNDLERAKRNLAREDERIAMEGVAIDGNMAYRLQMQQKYTRLYYAGQLPPNNLLNPIAWSKFIKAWQNGDFKKKEKK